MKNEIVFVEDNQEIAIEFYEEMDLNNILVRYIVNMEDARVLFQQKEKSLCYFIDVNLGKMNPKGGIELIKKIREYQPNSLIIVYTAYQNMEKECIKAGATYFFVKDADTYERDFRLFRNIIIHEKKLQRKQIKNSAIRI